MQDPEIEDRQSPNKNLNTVVSFLLSHKKSTPPPENSDYKALYSNINSVVRDLDNSISDCKKYNQAKIHRKYQIIISEMENKIQYLEKKVKEQRKARSPSKKYVEDLLEKLINLQAKNEVLSKEISELKGQNEELKKKVYIYQHSQNVNEDDNASISKKDTNSPGKLSRSKSPVKDQEDEETQQTINISEEVSSFLRFKYEFRKHEKNSEKSSFERFLVKVKEKLTVWSIRQFLTAIDKWAIEQKQYMEKNNFREVNYSVPDKRVKAFDRLTPSIQAPKKIQLSNTFSHRLKKNKNIRANYLNLPEMKNREYISQKKLEVNMPSKDCLR